MQHPKFLLLHYLFVYLLCCFCQFSFAQSKVTTLNADDWAKKLSDPSPINNDYVREVNTLMINADRNKEFIDALEKKGDGIHFKARFLIIKAYGHYLQGIDNQLTHIEHTVDNDYKKEIIRLMDEAISKAYESNDDYLIGAISIYYGQNSFTLKEFELAMMYMINGLELNEKIKAKNIPQNYQIMGELLFKIKDYKESVIYTLKALKDWQNPKNRLDSTYIMWAYNTAALGYHRQLVYDSAFFFYKKTLQLANSLQNDIWKGIVSGNMGQIYYAQKQYDTALSLLLTDYTKSKNVELLDNAANSLQWAARAELAKGNKTTALQYVREAFRLLAKNPDVFYLRNCYFTSTETFKAFGAFDSAFYYNKKYETLNDSLEKVIVLSSIKVAKIRAADEKNRYNIKMLQREKEKQLWLRNILIVAILVLTVIGLLFFNRQQLKNRLKLERLEQEKQRMKLEMESAKEQMKMFTANIVDKAAMIEKLEEQLKNKDISAEQQLLITELSRQTILTEDDWNQFKTLFEKIYPGFFINLKQKAPEITLAEQRMAALTRLQLTTKQMASTLGISVDSVHKTRQRLRQRFNLTTETNMEEFIAAI